MYDGMKLYRAVVTSSASATGAVYVSIPSVLGPTTTIGVSTIGRGPVNGVWAVPSVGDQVIVAVEDDKFSNLYLAYPAPQQTLTISDGSITTAKLANDAVTSEKIASNAVGSDEIAAGAVGQSELASDAVTTAKILNSNVTSSKIADGAVTDSKLNLSRVQATGVLTLGGPDSAAVTFDTKVFETAIIPFIDVPGDFFVPPIEGLYAISATIVSSSAGTNQSARLNINFINANQITFPPSTTLVFSHIAWLTPSDPVQLVIVNSSSILSRIYNCTFTMVRISG